MLRHEVAEIERAERDQKTGTELEERRRRLERLLDKREVQDAEREIEQLAQLGLARVTLDGYRERLAEVRSAYDELERHHTRGKIVLTP